jgi:hypothetical protein
MKGEKRKSKHIKFLQGQLVSHYPIIPLSHCPNSGGVLRLPFSISGA